MMISQKLLENFGVIISTINSGGILFHQGHKAYHYFQVKSGEVKMIHYTPEGQEFIQGIFGPGESFGEPAIFGDFPYPCGAITTQDSEIYKLPIDRFFALLESNFEVHRRFNKIFSQRLFYKATMLNEISSYPPAHRIKSLLEYFRLRFGTEEKSFQVPFTRQEIANMTGLRVETVIKTIKKMETEGSLKIKDHKVIIS
jgi:CRP-like cAMP-binding protein